MKTQHRRPSLKTSSSWGLALLISGVALSGCSSLDDTLSGGKLDYKSASTKGPALDVPPDLSQLTRDSRYVVPGADVSASSYQTGRATQPSQTTPIATSSVADVRIERAGNQRWLVVNRSADKLWEPVREFWKENGFTLNVEQQALGILETDFAENRAKIPEDFIRRTIGRVIDSLYSTGERDKYRTRLERAANGTTEIFISHRGMVETLPSGAVETGNTIWQPRPADPELEAEFLARLMVKLGAVPEQAKAAVASSAPRQTSRVTSVNNIPVVQVDEGFERAWRRVGLALDRTGFTVEDRDRAQGLYFVRYMALVADDKKTGFFGNLFSSKPATAAPLKYRIALRSQGESTTVSVLNAQGQPETSVNAQRIVQVLADDLK